MLTKIILWLISPILFLIAVVIIKDLLAYIRYSQLYKGQKIPYSYVPWFGLMTLALPPKDHRDSNNGFNKIANETFKNEEIICSNSFNRPQPNIMLLKPKIIREFFAKETKHTKRVEIIKVPLNIGFFFDSGDHAMMMRGVFNKFFQPENLNNITPQLREKIEGWMKKIHKENWSEGEDNAEFKRIDMRDYMPKIMSTIANEVLFGVTELPKIDEMDLPEADEKLLNLIYNKVMRNPLHIMTFGLLHRLNIFKASREAQDLSRKMEKVCEECIRKRMKEVKKEELGCTVMDLMIKYNLEAKEKDKIPMEDMVGNSLSFIAAGQDTSKNTIEILIYELSTRPEKLKKLVEEEIPKLFDSEMDRKKYDAYFQSDYLNALINESLRRDGPAATLFPRQVTKTMNLGNYKIYKGTVININLHGCHMNEDYFENSEEFDEKRFLDKDKFRKMEKGTFMPFSLGKRACIGKNLAQLVIRVMLSTFFEAFEVRVIDGRKRKTVLRFAKGIEDCVIDIRPRKRIIG